MAPLISRLLSFLPPALLLAALLVAILMAYRLWGEMNEDVEPVSDSDILLELEEAHAAGEIDADEMNRVRDLLDRPGARGRQFPRSKPSRPGPMSSPPPPEAPPPPSDATDTPGTS